MKKILGLDLGTNSIGWSLVDLDFETKNGNIDGLGSRIIPMGQDTLGKFDAGVKISQTAERTGYRSTRKLYQRVLLRRERLHRVLNVLGFLPDHYEQAIDFERHMGQFKEGCEPKISFKKNGQAKHEFLFIESFNEMIEEFRSNGNQDKLPQDWTIYYLRKKALTTKIAKEELAWILLNFNQKRGYYQLRGDEEQDDSNQAKELFELKVKEVKDSGEKVRGNTLFNIVFENGWEYDRQITKPEDWIGKTKEFIVTTSLTKNGDTKRTYKAVDSEKDWVAIKSKTEQQILNANKTVGQYIYETLLVNPTQKIRGKLVRTIERKFYKDELAKILETQCKLHSELNSESLYEACVEELYPYNQSHQYKLKNKGFKYLFLEDIIFYQRPLKSKKSSIGKCQYEIRTYKKLIKLTENGKTIEKEVLVNEPLKGISKSHPLYQEFRLWQFLRNLRLHKKTGIVNGKAEIDIDVTKELLKSKADWSDLFDYLNEQKDIDQNQVINYLVKTNIIDKKEKFNYRWNYVEDKKYPCNETRYLLVSRLKKVENVEPTTFLTAEIERKLWHIIYSVTDRIAYEKALQTFAQKHKLDVHSFVDSFVKIPPFKSDFGAYSEKAIKKLLPLMRFGKLWQQGEVSKDIVEKANDIIKILQTINFDKKRLSEIKTDSDFSLALLKSFCDFESENPIEGLNTYQACYLIYNRHSETGSIDLWKSPSDIDDFLKEFKQHSLRNPIVEQVITETLRVVRDIWEFYGQGIENFFDEIHIELGREMKNPAKKRQEISKTISENENTNFRIKEILEELLNDKDVEGDVRPYSPSHQEILKIYEEGVFQNPNTSFDVLKLEEIEKLRKTTSPSKQEIKKYKLWLDQGYVSPYTGQVIPLSKLFTIDFQIEHIIPQSRYFDDSLSNKIICESEINQLKDNRTAYEFLKAENGRIVEMANGKTIRLFSIENYENHCNKYFGRNKSKLKKLLSEEIPEGFIARQLNDSRYISKLIKSYLSNLVREENEVDAISKHVVPVTGAITSILKNDWGLNDKWNELVAYRFKRMNELTSSENYATFDKSLNAFRLSVPVDIARGFSKKRVDHRHHALDALVIACTTKDHVNYISSLNDQRKNYSLVKKLRKMKDVQTVNYETGEIWLRKVASDYHLPWPAFPLEAKQNLEKVIVSFKQNNRVINKTTNKTWQWVNQNGRYNKELVKQTKGDSWAIRKPMHKETVSGVVAIRIKKDASFANGIKQWEKLVDKTLKRQIQELVNKGLSEKGIRDLFKENPYTIDGKEVKKLLLYDETKNATASRVSLSDQLTRKQLENITDSGIQSILEQHLKLYTAIDGKEHFDLAFSAEGVEAMNNNIVSLNNGKPHKPIYKVRIYEEGSKFRLGQTGNKKDKFVEAAKNTNLFFAVYWNEERQKREFETVPLNEVIEHQKWRTTLPVHEMKATPLLPIDNRKGKFLFSLSPNDLVYVPSESELSNQNSSIINVEEMQPQQVYKMVSCTGSECHFIQNPIANLIKKYDSATKFGEMGSLNKQEVDLEGNRIKEVCIKIEADRLGQIKIAQR